jgi:hypothetical protein
MWARGVLFHNFVISDIQWYVHYDIVKFIHGLRIDLQN